MPTIPAQEFLGYTIPQLQYGEGITAARSNYARYNVMVDVTFNVPMCGLMGNQLPTGYYRPYCGLYATSDPDVSYSGLPSGYSLSSGNFNTDGKTVYWFCTYNDVPLDNVPYNNIDLRAAGGIQYVNHDRLAWLMVYGDNIPNGYNVTYDLVGCVGDSANPSIIPMNATVTNFSFTPDSGFSFNSGSIWIEGDGYPSGTPVVYAFDSETGNLRVGPISSDIVIHVHAYTDPYNDPDNPDLIDGESDIPGGDAISVPNFPGITAVSSGMIGLFNPTASQMQLLADYMWTDFGGTGSTTEDILKEIVQAIKRSISNPLDYVIGLNIIPSQGLSVGQSTSVRFGFVNSNVSMPRLTSQYFTVDCGSLSFDKLCGDTFLDYAPYSKFSLYLPYIGVKEMDANDFVGHTISILYHGDVVTGGVTAYILKDGSVMYQYSGCCALTIPLSADSWGNTISGAIQIATTLIGGAAVSSAGSGFAAKRAGIMAATGAANIASNPSLLSPQVMRSGAISGGAGAMASQKPFVIREAARFHTTEGFNTIAGYPSYYYRSLSSMHGFTSVLDVHLHGIPGTHEELAEIESLLKEGVIL